MGADEARVRLTEGAGDGLLAAIDGDVSEAEGHGASRVHNDRWGRTARTKEVDLRRALRAEKGGREEGPGWADCYLAVLAIRLGRKGDGVGAF